ncbi:MAG: glycosyltransferase, partial [Streptosporangiaceae bacterium]
MTRRPGPPVVPKVAPLVAPRVSPQVAPQVVRPGDLGLRDDAPLPAGFTIELEPDTRQLASDVLFGGSPARVLRLSPAGSRALAELRAGPVASAASAVLARRLTDTSMARPIPPQPSPPQPGPPRPSPPQPSPPRPDPPRPACWPNGRGVPVTVVVPVRDRQAELDRCLAAAGRDYPVLVVDDGSADPAAVAAICTAHGARLVRREVSGGPGPARNTALSFIGTEFVAFLDSDCVPGPAWIAGLAGHFADPLVAAVAPRIVAAPI